MNTGQPEESRRDSMRPPFSKSLEDYKIEHPLPAHRNNHAILEGNTQVQVIYASRRQRKIIFTTLTAYIQNV